MGVRIDPTGGDDQALRLKGELSRGEWRGAHQLLASTKDFDQRDLYLEIIADQKGRPKWLDQWAEAESQSPIPWLVQGAHALKWAWEARGSGRGSSVTEDGARLFFERLELAEQLLSKAIDLDPADPGPRARLLISARGRELPLESTRHRFDEVVSRHRFHRLAHAMMLQAVCEKWGGSHEQMFEFVRGVSRSAPEGHGIHALIAEAHVERWLYFLMEDDEAGADAYFKRADVVAEITEAAGRSVRSPQFKKSPWWVRDRGSFAFAFWLAGKRPFAREQFEKLGPFMHDHPWAYLGDATGTFEAARQECSSSSAAGAGAAARSRNAGGSQQQQQQAILAGLALVILGVVAYFLFSS